jgi:hypothetical protein
LVGNVLISVSPLLDSASLFVADQTVAAISNHPFECIERYRNVALTNTEKAADANDNGLDLAILINENLAYVSNMFVLLIVGAS